MSRDVPNVVVFAFAVVVAISAVAVPTAALGGSPSPLASPADATTDEVLPQTTANGTETATNGTATPTSDTGANESVAPGQQLAGVVGVQGAEIEGEIGERSFSTRISRTESNISKAAVVAMEVNQARDRLASLRERQERLREAYQSGELSTGEYRARMAVTSAQIRSVENQLDANDQVASELPAEALATSGVDRTELDRLRADADELQGPEVAEISRQIAGENPGRELDPERGPDELPEPARGDEDDDEDEDEEEEGTPSDGANAEPPEDVGAPDDAGPPENSGEGEDANNQSTGAGPPEDSGEGEDADNQSTGAGPPEDSGENGESDDSGSSGDAGNSGDSGNGSDAGESGDSGNSGDAGKSGDSGNGSDAGESGDSGNSGDAGNSGNSGSSGGSDDSGNSGNAGDSGGSGGGNDGNSGGSDGAGADR